MALWKARGEKFIMEGKGEGKLNKNSEFRSWHCGRQGGGSLNKNKNLEHGIVEGKEGGASEQAGGRYWRRK